jgi:hypothetical protein
MAQRRIKSKYRFSPYIRLSPPLLWRDIQLHRSGQFGLALVEGEKTSGLGKVEEVNAVFAVAFPVGWGF